MIKGDLDSIRPDVQTFYASQVLSSLAIDMRSRPKNRQGTEIFEDKNLYATDLMKCLHEVPQENVISVTDFR